MTQVLVDSCTSSGWSSKAGAQSLKDEWPRNTLNFSFHEFPVPTLRSFQPSLFYIRVGGRIKLGEQNAQQLKFFFAAERTDVLLDLLYCLSHDAIPLNRCCVRVYLWFCHVAIGDRASVEDGGLRGSPRRQRRVTV